MSFILTILTVMFIMDVLWWWRADRRARRMKLRSGWRAAIALFMTLMLGCLAWVILGRTVFENPDESLPRFLMAAVFLWHFIIVPVSLISEVGFSVARWAILLPRRSSAMANADSADRWTRREFLTAAAATPPAITLLATGASLRQLDDFRIRRIDLPLANLPLELDGLSIAHVADIHVGRFTGGRTLKKIVDATNNLRSDMVLFAGDLINHALSDLPEGIHMIRRMEGRSGLFMCEGNHDLIESRAGFESRIRAAKLPMLINESETIRVRGREVQILGLRWGGFGPGQRGDRGIAASMQRLLPQLRPDAFPILLAHHPHAFDFAADANIPLTLSGHTHGGQLMLTKNLGFGPAMFRYWSGVYDKGASKLVVSNGVGNWFPLRINAPAEIIHLTLRRSS